MGLFTQFRQKQMHASNAAVAHHRSMIDAYLGRLAREPQAPAQRHVTILARSAVSPVARALVASTEALKDEGVFAQAILAQLDPREALIELTESLRALAPARPIADLVRWANRSCILDAHEQLILGPRMCWSGDMMRREPGKRDGLDLFEQDAPQTVRLGTLAFEAIWSITMAVPASRLRDGAGKQGGSYRAPLGPELPKPPFPQPGEQPPLLRN